jgi:hypothetical protein
MTGFDRPLKPAWIYNFVKIVEIGDTITDHKPEFNKILWELDGEEGKRKVRTVLSRYFMKTQKNPKSKTVEYTPIIEICKTYPLEKIKPLMLFYLLSRSEVLRNLSIIIFEVYRKKKDIDYHFLRKKIIEKYGERDISSRSLRNFLTTLEYFDILIKQNHIYKWTKKLQPDEMNICYMLKFYSGEYKKSPQIFIDEIEQYIIQYFKIPDLGNICRKYNKKLWEYSQILNKKQIVFHKSYKWDISLINKTFL